MPRKIQILLVDDHSILRCALAEMLNGLADLEVVGQAEDGLEAVELARERRPHVVLMDFNMPRMNGLDATRRIVSQMPEIKIIALSMYDSECMASRMLSAGAARYLSKQGDPEELVAAIRAEARASRLQRASTE